MRLADLFARHDWMELAVALSALPGHAAPVRLAEAGIHPHQHEDFLRLVASINALQGHLACADCQQGVACLDDNTLAEFVDGVLPPEAVPTVERQLAQCGACLHKALELARITHELAPRRVWPEVVVAFARRGLRILAKPAEGFQPLALQPLALMGPDLDAAAQRWTQTHGEIEGVFTLSVDASGSVTAQVGFSCEGKPVSGGRVALRMDDLLLESLALPESGEHTFWGLTPGRYLIELEATGLAPASFALDLRQES